jgi:hypothetical protein
LPKGRADNLPQTTVYLERSPRRLVSGGRVSSPSE